MTEADDPALALQAASLRAGVFAVVMIVIVCFGAAFAFSERPAGATGAGDRGSVSADSETLKSAP